MIRLRTDAKGAKIGEYTPDPSQRPGAYLSGGTLNIHSEAGKTASLQLNLIESGSGTPVGPARRTLPRHTSARAIAS